MIAAERWGQLDSYYHALPGGLIRARTHRLMNFVYSWCVERVPEDKLDEWITELHDLLPWQDADSTAGEEAEAASFFAMQAAQQG